MTNAGNGIGHFVAIVTVGGRPAPITVRVSHPATNLQAAISIAQPGDLVAANAGVYTNDSVVYEELG